MRETSYVCRVCFARPVFSGLAAAAAHAGSEHADELEDRHYTELIEVVKPVVERTPPFTCLICKDGTSYFNETSVLGHIKTQHEVGEPQIGEEYCSSVEWHARVQQRRLEERADRERRFDRTATDERVERFALVVASLRGVADFLTECGDEPAPRGA